MKMIASDPRRSWNSPTPGMVGTTSDGRPSGMGPTMVTPCAARSSAEEATIPRATTMIVRGSLGERRITSSSAMLTEPTMSVGMLVSGSDLMTPMSTWK